MGTIKPITVERCLDPVLLKELHTIPELFEVCMDGTGHDDPEAYEPDMSQLHLLIRAADGTLLGFSIIEVDTALVAKQHFRLLPQYWGTGITQDVQYAIEDHLRENYQFQRVVGVTPGAAVEQIRAALKAGFAIEGVIKRAMYYRNQITDMVILAKDL